MYLLSKFYVLFNILLNEHTLFGPNSNSIINLILGFNSVVVNYLFSHNNISMGIEPFIREDE